jgi:hypothetical protein
MFRRIVGFGQAVCETVNLRVLFGRRVHLCAGMQAGRLAHAKHHGLTIPEGGSHQPLPDNEVIPPHT